MQQLSMIYIAVDNSHVSRCHSLAEPPAVKLAESMQPQLKKFVLVRVKSKENKNFVPVAEWAKK